MLSELFWTIAESVRELRELAARLEPQQPEVAGSMRQIAAYLATPVQRRLKERLVEAKARPELYSPANVHQYQLTLQVLGEASEAEQARADQLFEFLRGEYARLQGEVPPLVEWMKEEWNKGEQHPPQPGSFPVVDSTPE